MSEARGAREREVDPEIREVFVEEAREVLARAVDDHRRWRESGDREALTATRRAFHTLKGSGRMVGAEEVGELAWSVENLLNRVIDGRVAAEPAVHEVVAEALDLLAPLTEDFGAARAPAPARLERAAALQRRAEALAQGRAAAEGSGDDELARIFLAEARGHLEVLRGWVDAQQERAPFFQPPPPALQAALHTLKGSAQMAEVEPMARLAVPLERLVKALVTEGRPPTASQLALLGECAAWGLDALAALEAGRSPEGATLETLVERLQGERESLPEGAAADGALERLLARGLAGLFAADQLLARWREAGKIDEGERRVLMEDLQAVAAAAGEARLSGLARLAETLLAVYRRAGHSAAPDDSGVERLLAAHDQLLAAIDAAAAHQEPPPPDERLLEDLARLTFAAPLRLPALALDELAHEAREADPEVLGLFVAEAEDLLDELDRLLERWRSRAGDGEAARAVYRALHTLKGGARMAGLESLGTFCHEVEEAVGRLPAGAAPPDGLAALPDRLAAALERIRAARRAPETADAAAHSPAAQIAGEVEPEVVAAFFAEGGELLDELQRSLEAWQAAPEETAHGKAAARALHTFKGSARMAGFLELGRAAHELEGLVEGRERRVARGEVEAVREMLERADALARAFAEVRRTFGERLEQPAAEASAQPAWQGAEILPFTGTYRGLDPLRQGVAADGELHQEVVRIPARLLDELVNLAGETSIARSQVEQNIHEFLFSLEEMEATVRRMQDQVRRLAIETEAQILFRREQIEAAESLEGFDPLEMDRYSQLQQLARALMESASDLNDLRATLVDKTRDAEALLLQQSRINTDLQEGLMRTRMVPFSRVVPRLRRVVRQVSAELGKEVRLEFGNVEGELDRSVLERMLAPLEHMLRNAIDHGLESPEERRALGKDPVGTISVSFARDGADVLIRVADDGRGIDVDAVRERAFAQGLLDEGRDYSDDELVRFIFHPGFSTARSVTQTSGRGVGMDVVDSEVRQLGGAVTLTTRRGAGTEFTVRLPFTVSVNRALMIQLGEDVYALALNTVEGVTRLPVEEVARLYADPEARFHYAGEAYELRFLGTLLSEELRPVLDTALGQVPLVLTRVDGRRYAVQVDALAGSREVVVKGLGPQFSQVPGLSGATVLGDGRVVVILDLQGLLRDQATAKVLPPLTAEELAGRAEREERAPQVPTILVVDDSVTVRKVTSRFLEREGFQVFTARDGVEAMRVLQEVTPDLMLLDIEMPRMDGFEVARLVRSTQRLKELPIIMITSRTGEKHRERALATGVDRYLGKPYQEEVLLREVRDLLAASRRARA
ncbi:MAG: hypothetical protein KatS3mg124_1396 [Porticoccaceae bacterium]|nr:MAG: hypothetical protein KatS3mg124_1396 [Porticoccaceae bacterium]